MHIVVIYKNVYIYICTHIYICIYVCACVRCIHLYAYVMYM